MVTVEESRILRPSRGRKVGLDEEAMRRIDFEAPTEAKPALSEIVAGIDKQRAVWRGDANWKAFLEALYADLVLAHPVAADVTLALLRFARYLQVDATPTSALREFLSVHRAAQLRLLVGAGAQDATMALTNS